MEPSVLIDKVKAVIDPFLEEDQSYFCVQIKIKPTNNIKVFLDGDKGLPIERCTFFNRKLYKAIEEEAWFPEGDFSLEVSSPGVDEPLILNRQYQKNIGRKVMVTLNDASEKIGQLMTVSETEIVLEWTEGKGKKAIQQQLLIPFENIKSTIVQVQF
ncbi:MAG: ribosome maturation factor [Bacteroidetes bacterium]|nr:ribosome maturation factor [Bacteroidota bacterium]